MDLPIYLTWGPLWCSANFHNRNNMIHDHQQSIVVCLSFQVGRQHPLCFFFFFIWFRILVAMPIGSSCSKFSWRWWWTFSLNCCSHCQDGSLMMIGCRSFCHFVGASTHIKVRIGWCVSSKGTCYSGSNNEATHVVFHGAMSGDAVSRWSSDGGFLQRILQPRLAVAMGQILLLQSMGQN